MGVLDFREDRVSTCCCSVAASTRTAVSVLAVKAIVCGRIVIPTRKLLSVNFLKNSSAYRSISGDKLAN